MCLRRNITHKTTDRNNKISITVDSRGYFCVSGLKKDFAYLPDARLDAIIFKFLIEDFIMAALRLVLNVIQRPKEPPKTNNNKWHNKYGFATRNTSHTTLHSPDF